MIIKKRVEKQVQENKAQTPKAEENKQEELFDIFDLDNIDFSQRQERRRGDRRRGFRRIDDRNLISRAQEEAGNIKDAAAKDGYQAGLERAREDIEKLKSALNEFMEAKEQVFGYIAPDILEISVDIAKKIVKKEIEQDPQILLDTILDVMKDLSRDEKKITILVNPTQLGLTKENLPSIISESGIDARINVSSDATIDIGGCIIQTNNGIVDATIETQLEIIKEAFKGQ